MKNKKNLAMTALWLAALVCCLLLADKLMRRDDSERKYGAFYADKQGFDVLFMGTSRVLDAIQPMEMWRDWGITSYNMGNNSEPLAMTAKTLELAMDTHVPRIAVIDVFYMMHALDEAWTYPYRHTFLDMVPLSRAKIKVVQETMPEDEWLEFLMPFSLYHGRWDEILSGSTERQIDCEPFTMGGELRSGRAKNEDFVLTDEIEQSELPGDEGMRAIAKVCRDNGVEPVFVALPGYATQAEQMAMNRAELIAQELGVPFVNMMREGVIDFDADCLDTVGHLKPDGASKATAYLGAWLTAHFKIEDKRGQSAYPYWDENLAKYEAHRAQVWKD